MDSLIVSIIVAIIGATGSVLGSILSYRAAVSKVIHTMDIQQAVMKTEMDIMKEDIKEHNHYAKLFSESMPVVKEQIASTQNQINEVNRRIDKLENQLTNVIQFTKA